MAEAQRLSETLRDSQGLSGTLRDSQGLSGSVVVFKFGLGLETIFCLLGLVSVSKAKRLGLDSVSAAFKNLWTRSHLGLDPLKTRS